MSSSERGKKNRRLRTRRNRRKQRNQDDQDSVPGGFQLTQQQGSNRTTKSDSQLGRSAHSQGQRRGHSTQHTDGDRVQESYQRQSSLQIPSAANRHGKGCAENDISSPINGHRTDGAAGFRNEGQRPRNSWGNPSQRYGEKATWSRTRGYHNVRDKWKNKMVSKDSHREGRPWKEQRKGSQQEWEEGQSGDAVARLPAGGGRGQRSSAAAASSSSSPSTGGQQAASEIPGFYYDPEKKKHFRILPGHNNYNPLTTAHIQQKQQEETRQELLKQDRNRTVPKVKVRGSTRTASCGPRLLLKRQLGHFSAGLSQRCAEESFLVEMDKQKLMVNLYDSSNQDSVNFLALEPDSKCERLLALSDARRISSCQLDFVSFMALNTLDAMQKSYMQYFTPGKVTGICWASVTGPESHALFSVLDEGPDTPSCARLVCAEVMANEHLIPGPGGAGLVRGRNYEVKSAWTCAWNSNPLFSKCFSIGANNSSIVIDAFTGQRDVINTKSDVFAQRFCNTTPVLLSGTRRGEILGSDLRVRTRCRGTAMTLRHESSVCCLRLLQDENYLLASDMQGKIKIWDLRMQKCMLDYPGHVNQYAHIPVIVDSQEKFIFAVGQDCHTRMWNLQDGQLLRTIPSIHPTAQTSRPTIAFSWGWGGEGGTPGLLMGIKDELYWYKLGLSD